MKVTCNCTNAVPTIKNEEHKYHCVSVCPDSLVHPEHHYQLEEARRRLSKRV